MTLTDSVEDDDLGPVEFDLLFEQGGARFDLLAAQLAAVARRARHDVGEADAVLEHARVVLGRQRRADQARHVHALP